MEVIKIYDFTGRQAIEDSDGDFVYKKIVEAFNKNENVILDFENVETILSIFLNSATGQLYKDYNSEYLNTHLKVDNISPEDKKTLKRVNERAKVFYADQKGMIQFLEGEVFDE